jgi:uncharacterized coiled-coil protein SlyX
MLTQATRGYGPHMDKIDDIVELEIKLAYQDRKISDLDALVRKLTDRVETVERELAEVKRALTPEAFVNEPPPHY